MEPTMTTTRFSILIATLSAVGGLSTFASAQAPAVAPTACPASYFKLDTIWYNDTTKAVVSTAETTASADRKGWTLGDLCQHDRTGDVLIFDRKAPTAPQSAAR